jgi:hypothetical protein
VKRILLLLGLAAALGSCGLRKPLAPLQGQHMPPAPAMANRPLTTDEMITPPIIARPARLDELLQRSEERPDDRFNLPPGDVPTDSNAPATNTVAGNASSSASPQ